MRRVLIFLVFLLLLGWGASCLTFVDETEKAFVTRFGRIVPQKEKLSPGLVVKLPWPIEQVRRFDRRLQVYEPPALERVTKDKKSLTVSSYICWKVEDAQRFFRTVGSIPQGNRRLEEQVSAQLSAAIGQRDLADLVSVQPGQSQVDSMMSQLTDQLQPVAKEQFGISLVDVRLRRFNHPTEVRQAIYDRIRSERNRDAVEYRSEGDSRAEQIRSRANLERDTVLAKAEAEAIKIRGEADAERTRVLNQAQAKDPQFFDLLRTLEAYQKILDDKTTLVLSTDNPLFRWLTAKDLSTPKPPTESPAVQTEASKKDDGPQPSTSGGP